MLFCFFSQQPSLKPEYFTAVLLLFCKMMAGVKKKKRHFLNVFCPSLLKRDCKNKGSSKGKGLTNSEVCFLGRLKVWCVVGLLLLELVESRRTANFTIFAKTKCHVHLVALLNFIPACCQPYHLPPWQG